MPARTDPPRSCTNGAGVHLPWGLLLAVVLTGTGIAALAGLYPALVAASLPIVASLKHFE